MPFARKDRADRFGDFHRRDPAPEYALTGGDAPAAVILTFALLACGCCHAPGHSNATS
jgi:hypothetical protein